MRVSAASPAHLTRRGRASLAIIAAACLILINSLLHPSVYGNRNYREDEIWLLRMFELYSGSTLVVESGDDPAPVGFRLAADMWVDAFGIAEPVVRWSSKLINLLSFALVYQLGLHVLDRRAGLYAIALLGLYGFAANGMSEFRPYPALAAVATALHLVYFHWLGKPTGRLMISYVCLGIAAVYTHLYAFTIFPAHALLLLLVRRGQRQLILHTLAMWCFVGLAFAPWVLPVLQSVLLTFGGGYYSIALAEFARQVAFQPSLIFVFLLLLNLVVLGQAWKQREPSPAWRWPPLARLGYPTLLLLGVYAFALAVNSVWSVMNPRGFMSVVSLVALMLAIGLWLLPTKAGVILLCLLYLQAPAHITVPTTNGPYREIVAEMTKSYESDSLVITEFDWAWRWLLGAAYYLMDFTPDSMSKARIFHLVEPRDSAHPPNYPDELVNIHKTFDPEYFSSQLPNHSQLWRLQEGGGNELGFELTDWLNRNYAQIRTVNWDEEYVTSYSLSEYARVPAHDGPILDVGESLRLFAWEGHESAGAAPCQTVTIESWWRIEALDSTPYTISIILADADGDGQLAISNSVPADQFTSDWTPNRFYRDRTALVIPCDISGGYYDLLLAVKESMSGEALLLAYPGGDAIGREYYLTTLNVEDS